MAFGASSKIFSSWMHDSAKRTGDADVDSATVKAALFNDSVTPNQLDTSAHNAYGGAGGQWAANNVTDTGTGNPAGWPTVGRPLVWGSATKITSASDATLKYDADDTVSGTSTTTLTNAFGTLIYDDNATTPADQGFCYLSFGGSAQGVTLGTFTIVYHANGIMSIAM